MKKLENLKEFQLNNEMKNVTGGEDVNFTIGGQTIIGSYSSFGPCRDFHGTVNGKRYDAFGCPE